MKKWILIAGAVLFLTGCAAQPTFETVDDVYAQPAVSSDYQMTLELPQSAAALTAQTDGQGSLYFCDGYTITVQVLQSGDLEKTLYETTGFDAKHLRPVETQPEGCKRYDWVFATAGEGEDQVCRGALLDDGVHHYVLTCMAGQSQVETVQNQWQALFDSFCLVTQEDLIRTGS